MAKIDLPKRWIVREKSVKSQGISKTILSGNPGFGYQRCFDSNVSTD